MAGLLNDVRGTQQLRHSVCTLARIRAKLDDSDQADLDTALADTDINGETIAAVLRSRGFTLQTQTLVRHRKGGCRCGRPG